MLWTPRWSTDPYIGGSNFFNYKDIMTRLVKQNKNILFIFRPHPLMFENFIKTKEMSSEELSEFKQYCEETENLILDEEKEYTSEFWQSDMLITDLSGMIPEYFITEKPIIYCHSTVAFNYTEYATNMISSCYEANDQKDLIKYFNELINGNDYKFSQRKECITAFFGNVNNNSKNILNVLANKKWSEKLC